MREAAGDRFADARAERLPVGLAGRSSPTTPRGEARAGHRPDLRERTGDRADRATRCSTSPHLFIGSVDGLVEKFVRLRERLGITSIMLGEIDELAPVVERLAGT